MEEQKNLKIIILSRLARNRVWGGKHVPLKNLIKGIPEQLTANNKGIKLIKETIKSLNNEQIILIKTKRTKKNYDKHVSLNPRKIKEIEVYLKQ